MAAKHLTTSVVDASRACSQGPVVRAALCLFLGVASIIDLPVADAQEPEPRAARSGRAPSDRIHTATIHWVDVPLRDAILRLQRLFNESVFLDRRIDPATRVTLAAEAAGVEDVMRRLAAEHGWGLTRLGDVVYVGPVPAATQLTQTLPRLQQTVAKLSRADRARFARERRLDWERLAEPRMLVAELIKSSGWKIENADRVPHDVWPAGRLDGLTLAEQLAVLLIGFDLTYEFRRDTRAIAIVDLKPSTDGAASEALAQTTRNSSTDAPTEKTRQVYSLRVEEKPVGAVTRELARRLNWQVEFDEAAIEAAGLSLDARVTFNVENVEQEELLQALLRPAGLTFEREGDGLVIVPRK